MVFIRGGLQILVRDRVEIPQPLPHTNGGKQEAVGVDRRVAPRGSLVEVQVLLIRPPPSVMYAISTAIGVETQSAPDPHLHQHT